MKNVNTYVRAGLCASVVKLLSSIKMSYIAGFGLSWFSFSSLFVPLSGAFAGIGGSTAVLIARFALRLCFFKSLSLSCLAFYVPGYCASLYWATRSALVRLVLPAACMVLFIAHPVGSQCFLYSFFWLVPVALFVMNTRSLFFEALGSTFVAHAVGSVIVLYTVSTTPDMWHTLIPVVCVERMCIALGIMVAYKALSAVQLYVRSFNTKATMQEAIVTESN